MNWAHLIINAQITQVELVICFQVIAQKDTKIDSKIEQTAFLETYTETPILVVAQLLPYTSKSSHI